MSLRSWFGGLKSTSRTRPNRRAKRTPDRRLEARRLLLEGLEDRNLMAFNFLADYATGQGPVDLSLASVNAGSQPDLVVAENGAGSVGVRLGIAGGTFDVLKTAATPSGPVSVATGDIDGDLIPDVVTANSADVSLLLGNGDGSFDLQPSIGLPAQFPPGYTGEALPQTPLSIATGDLNKDGKLDLVVGGQTSYSVLKKYEYCYWSCYTYYYLQTYNDGYVNVLLGDGTGGFGAATAHHIGDERYPTAIAVGDLNSDTNPDIIAADGSGLSVLLGDGTGAVGPASHSGSGYPLRSISLGDVDGDTKVDTLLSTGWGLSVQKGDGLGGFAAQPTKNTDIPVNSAVLGDVNADGKLDLVAAGSSNESHCTGYGTDYWGNPYCNAFAYTNTPQASVLINQGSDGFALPLVSSLRGESDGYGYLADVALANLNADGNPELVTIDSNSSLAIVATNNGNWDPPPAIAISNAAIVLEGNSGTVNAVFTVTISGNHTGVTVNYTTADNSAAAGADYTTKSGTLTFDPGVQEMTIMVPVVGDVRDENDEEQFFVNLFTPVGAQITDSQAIGTIQDDDLPPLLTINDVSMVEGNGGTMLFTFTVSLSVASGKTVSVNFATANGSATTANQDYVAKNGTASFSPGQLTATITVQVRGDKKKEGDETFFVDLSGATNATISDSRAIGTIKNNDGGAGKGRGKP